jgi:hypothetical protein
MTTLSEIKFHFIGWCHEVGHDKVWTTFDIGGKRFAAWGRRDGKLSFKDHGAASQYLGRINKLIQQKRDKGYEEVDEFKLFMIFPDFNDKVEQELMLKMLSGDIK